MLGFVDGRLKELGIADLLYLPQRALLFKPIDERLHGCVSNAFVLGEAFQDLAHRRGAEFPVLLQNTSFGFGKTRLFHDLLLIPAMLLQETGCGHPAVSVRTSACGSVSINAIVTINSRIVGNPSLIGLRKSCPSLDRNRDLPVSRC